MDIQTDYSLVQGDIVADVGSLVDNIHVTEDGEIIIATIPKLLQFSARADKAEGPCAAKVWKVRNETSEQQ